MENSHLGDTMVVTRRANGKDSKAEVKSVPAESPAIKSSAKAAASPKKIPAVKKAGVSKTKKETQIPLELKRVISDIVDKKVEKLQKDGIKLKKYKPLKKSPLKKRGPPKVKATKAVKENIEKKVAKTKKELIKGKQDAIKKTVEKKAKEIKTDQVPAKAKIKESKD